MYGPEVRDAAGTALAHPWLGGLNQPRPQLADVDGDGDLDLFVQERSGRIAGFENVGAAAAPRFVWRTDRFQGLDVGEWYRFSDLDGDGDPDLMGEARFSHVRLWRNEDGPQGAELRPWADTLRDADGEPLFSDRQNIPNATDIDGDGLVDLFVGRLTGTVSRFEETGRDAAGVPRFALVTDRFENIEIVAQIGSLHGANTLALGDVDADGDVDLFWGDFFEPGLLWIENTGSSGEPSLQGDPVPFPPGAPLRTSGYNAPALGDLDGDGELEILVGVLGGAYDPKTTSVDNFWLLDRAGDGWRAVTSRYLPTLDVGSESVPAFGDWDGDGDADLLVGDKIADDGRETARVFAFENVTTGSGEARFRALGPLPIEGSYHFAPALGDLDGDGDADLLLGTWRDGILAFRNDGPLPGGGARWTPLPEATLALSRGSNATPALGDVDGDGDLDLVAGEASGELNFWRNEGAEGSGWPSFALVTDRLGGVDAGRRSAPALADWDGDGGLDLLVGSESESVAVWRFGPPAGSGTAGNDEPPTLSGGEPVGDDLPAFAAPAIFDFDADGDADLFVGGVGGGVMLYERVAP